MNHETHPPKGGFFSRAESTEDVATKAIHAVEQWYARHFHSAATSGRQPITSDEKAALVAGIKAAITKED